MYLKRLNGDVIAESETKSLKELVYDSRADLSRADLSMADLSGANLSGANLSRADLSRADLSRANLSGANLSRADLSRAKRGVFEIKSKPIIISGLEWEVRIFDTHMEIGCQHHLFDTWSKFTDEEISKMSNSALKFWDDNKFLLLSYCEIKSVKA